MPAFPRIAWYSISFVALATKPTSDQFGLRRPDEDSQTPVAASTSTPRFHPHPSRWVLSVNLWISRIPFGSDFPFAPSPVTALQVNAVETMLYRAGFFAYDPIGHGDVRE